MCSNCLFANFQRTSVPVSGFFTIALGLPKPGDTVYGFGCISMLIPPFPAPGQRIGGIEVIPTPGHTPGHVSFLFGETLVSGDLVISNKGRLQPAPTFMSGVDKAALKRSLNEVKHFSFVWVCPAHGEPVQRGNLWDTLVERL